MKNNKKAGKVEPVQVGLKKSAITAFTVGAAEMFGMFATIWVLQNRKRIAFHIKSELDWIRKCRTESAVDGTTVTGNVTPGSK